MAADKAFHVLSPQCAVWESHSPADTDWLGRKLADLLQPGDVVALIGDLGAGKTQLVKAIAAGLGVPDDEVHSPTFTLIHEYTGRLLLEHCDAYRLRNPAEFVNLGLDELFGEDRVALIEWADRVIEDLPRRRLAVTIVADSATTRRVTFEASGRRYEGLLRELWGGPKADG